jgi:polysaccharide deacetylase 2 family uncharacterized protein YibQ
LRAAPRPRIAVILDDFGLDYKKTPPDSSWCSLPFPLTFAVMPRSPRTKEAALGAKACGKEVLIHFPFDPFLRLELPAEAPSPADIRKVSGLLEECVRTIPGAVGLNTHRSLKATRNGPLMRWFAGEVSRRKLFFVDSFVSPKSAAYSEARAAGLRCARNDLFLEPRRPDEAVCRGVLRSAAAIARRRGLAVVIGHHYHRTTLRCLESEVPALEKEGFEFVFASQAAD